MAAPEGETGLGRSAVPRVAPPRSAGLARAVGFGPASVITCTSPVTWLTSDVWLPALTVTHASLTLVSLLVIIYDACDVNVVFNTLLLKMCYFEHECYCDVCRLWHITLLSHLCYFQRVCHLCHAPLLTRVVWAWCAPDPLGLRALASLRCGVHTMTGWQTLAPRLCFLWRQLSRGWGLRWALLEDCETRHGVLFAFSPAAA